MRGWGNYCFTITTSDLDNEVCLHVISVGFSIAVIKHDQRKLGEERAYSILSVRVQHEGEPGQELKQEAGGRN